LCPPCQRDYQNPRYNYNSKLQLKTMILTAGMGNALCCAAADKLAANIDQYREAAKRFYKNTDLDAHVCAVLERL